MQPIGFYWFYASEKSARVVTMPYQLRKRDWADKDDLLYIPLFFLED